MLNRVLKALAALRKKPEFIRSAPQEGVLYMSHFTDNPPYPWYWPNFAPHELASKGNGTVNIEYRAINLLQKLRREWGRPLRVNSAYRDPAYNKKVGGAKRSKHMEGKAFDISVVGWTEEEKEEFKELAYTIGFRGFGGYGTFIHIDISTPRRWGQRWAWPEDLK